MDNQAAIRSSEKEDYAENQLQTKQTQQKKAVKENTVINHQKENENNGEEVNKDNSLNGATDSSKKRIDPKKLPRHGHINMSKARSLLSCEFCQGLMRKANVINPCIHRVCGGCINDCTKLGKKECPVCGTNYSSIVEDGNVSRIVATMFPETEKIELRRASELPAKDELCNKKKKLINDKNTLYNAKRSRSCATENSSTNNAKRSRSCAMENSSSYNAKRSRSCATESSSSSMSESVPSPSKSPPELTDEMLDRIGKKVVAAILKQQQKHQQPPPNTNGNKKSKPDQPNQQL